ncbi:unnamed protein product [Durusdinium trenchii]|uniref:Metalloendopeptidase n=1 Tax=Durusdinium trenchii TaxID=1381693 RepID=A0ABP0L2V4_9DINO
MSAPPRRAPRIDSVGEEHLLEYEDGESAEGEDALSRLPSTRSIRSVPFSIASSATVEAPREAFFLAYYNMHREERQLWSTRCTVLMVAVLFVALLCGLFRLVSHLHSRTEVDPSKVVLMNDFHSFASMGCFPLLGNDAPQAVSEGLARDFACMDPKKHDIWNQANCRSGLPFYRFSTGQVISWRWCAKLCLLKGLDISGVVDAKECRCGASQQNLQVWATDAAPGEFLQFQPSKALPSNSSECRLLAARFLGRLPIEAWRMDLNEEDLTYIRSIVSRAPVNSIERLPPGLPPKEKVVAPPPSRNWVEVALNSSCFPGQCASGWPWPIWTVYKQGIPFTYDETVDVLSKSSVRQAIERLQRMVCVKFTEVLPSDNSTYKIVFTKKDPGPCYAVPIGYPATFLRDAIVNLASCGQNVGVILHELGHALGMSHEQARQDRDDYVTINWMHVPKDYEAQYYVGSSSYIGSHTARFVPYDYHSVMHYSAGPAMNSLPMINGKGVHDDEMGQRNDFSPRDVVQLRDMYQCDGLRGSCADQDAQVAPMFRIGGSGATCEKLKDFCEDSDYGESIRYFCAQTCGTCPEISTVNAVEGCQDTEENVCKSLEDYCPGKGATGMEEYMSLHCRKRCCLPQFCQSCEEETAETPETKVNSASIPSRDSVRMKVFFDSPQYEKDQIRREELQLRFSALLGPGVTVELIQAPQCLAHCQDGEAYVRQICGCDRKEGSRCFQSCHELRLKWVLLTPGELSDYTGGILVRHKEVDVPSIFEPGGWQWQNIVAYATQHRGWKYLAAAIFAVALLLLLLLLGFRFWWKSVKSERDEDPAADLRGLKRGVSSSTIASSATSHSEISLQELGEILRDQEREGNLQAVSDSFSSCSHRTPSMQIRIDHH